jgi:hypothetical protein
MSIEEVIESGKLFSKATFGVAEAILIIVPIIIALFGYIMYSVVKKGKINLDNEKHLLIAIAIVALYLFSMSIILETKSQNTYNKEKEVWVKDKVEVYINSLDSNIYEVRKIDNETPWNVSGKDDTQWQTSDYRISDEPVKLTYLDDEKRIINLSAYLEIRASEKPEPYLEYKGVSKDLGHGYEKGNYNMILYIPTEYDLD